MTEYEKQQSDARDEVLRHATTVAIPTDDADAIARIRKLGYRPEMAEAMVGLFQCSRALGMGLIDAFKETLLASLSDESLRTVGSPDCLRALAERAARAP